MKPDDENDSLVTLTVTDGTGHDEYEKKFSILCDSAEDVKAFMAALIKFLVEGK